MNTNIAVPTMNGQVVLHVGRATEFTIYRVEDKEIKEEKVVPITDNNPGAIPLQLKELNVNTLVCDFIGERAILYLQQYGTTLVTGATGVAKTAVESYLNGTLSTTNEATQMYGRGLGLQRGMGRKRGMGLGAGRGMGRGAGRGMGRGAGRGMGQGAGRGMGQGAGRGMGLGLRRRDGSCLNFN